MINIRPGVQIFIILYFCCSLLLFPDTKSLKLESRLAESTGEKRIAILTELAEMYMTTAPKKALEYGREALELLKSYQDANKKMIILNHTSKAYSLLGEFSLAENDARKSLTIAQTLGDKNGEADAFVSISRVYWDQGDYQQARKYCFDAQEIYKKTRNNKGMAITFQMLGTLYWRLSDFPVALDYALKSAEIFRLLEDLRGKTGLEMLIARIYSAQNQYEKSLEYSFKALQGYEKLADRNGIAICYNNIGNDYRKSGNNKEALEFLKQASEIFKEMKSKRPYSYTLNNIGDVYAAQRDYDQAQDYFSRSLKIKEELNDQMGIAYTLINSGKTMRIRGQNKEAIQLLLRALDIASKINIKNEIRTAYQELSESYEAQGDYAKALHYHKKYKEINDSIFDTNNIKKTAELQTRFETEKKEKEIALLRKDKELQQLNILKQQNLINSLIIISLLVFSLTLLTRYRLKTKAAEALKQEIEDRKRVEAELIKSQKLEAVGILAEGIAHDFNNLLSIIMCNLTLAANNLYDNPRVAAKKLNTVEEVCDQASELSQKLITISTGGWILSQKITLAEILEEVEDYFPEIKTFIGKVNFSPDLKPIYGDVRQLRQVICNLLKNASQAMKEPKEVIINSENVFLEDVNDFSLKKGYYIKVSIVDNGIGIPEDELGKIFVPYFSTKSNVTQKGRGLGLALCYSIIKRHNGNIAIKSELGKGTTVDLYLPAFIEN